MKFQNLKKLIPSFLAPILIFTFIGISQPASAQIAPPETTLQPSSASASSAQGGDCYGTVANPKDPSKSSNPNCVPRQVNKNIAGGSDSIILDKYVNPFINLLTVLVSLAVVIGIIYGGIEYSMSGGDPQKAAVGKNRIRNSFIGLIAFVLVFAFLNFLVPGGIGFIRV